MNSQPHPSKRRGNSLRAAGLLTGLLLCAATAQEVKLTEYQMKALYLFNFTQFVEWPDDTFAATNSPFIIGVLGDDPFGKDLDALTKSETARHRPLVVQRSRQVAELKNCQLLFICQSEKTRLRQILNELGDASVLTVSETPGFARQGGIIGLLLESGTVRFEINNSTAKNKRLIIKSSLLKMAKKVFSEPQKENKS